MERRLGYVHLIHPLTYGPPLTFGDDMPELMLKPRWPGNFRRTILVGGESKVIEFHPGDPVEVTDEEFAALAPDIGVAVFEVERDEKGRPRYVESRSGEEAEESKADAPAAASPVESLNARDAIESIEAMRSKDKLQSIIDTDPRVTVQEAAKKRLESL